VQWEKYVQETLKFMKYVPIMFCSAKTGNAPRVEGCGVEAMHSRWCVNVP
jgi:hypothetical protein